jgi:hypothetical protein
MDQAREISRMQLRLPTDLKDWIKQHAAENCRSLNGEIVSILEQCRANGNGKSKKAKPRKD